MSPAGRPQWITIAVRNKAEGTAMSRALADPATRALVNIMGELLLLRNDSGALRALNAAIAAIDRLDGPSAPTTTHTRVAQRVAP